MDDKRKAAVLKQVLANQEKNQDRDPFEVFSENSFTMPIDLSETPCPRCGGKLEGRSMLGNALAGVVRCTECEYRDGLSSFWAKSIFPVQRMPEGAKPIYDKEPDDDSK
jgi:hypothetical protein